MSESAYKNHPIRGLISQIKDIEKNDLFYTANIAESEQLSYCRDKIFATTEVIDAYLKQTPAILASIYGLNQLNSSFQNVANEANSFVGDKNTAHLINAANNIDTNVLPQLWSLMPQTQKISPEIFSEISEKLRNTSILTIKELEKQKNELLENITELKTEISNQKSSLESLNEVLKSKKTEAEVIAANMQKEFAESETKRSTEFNQKISEFDIAYRNYESDAGTKKNELLSHWG
jgi:predicted RNase H-like nuclease (RuvC/YqgF family)